jgi:hypothetical protein
MPTVIVSPPPSSRISTLLEVPRVSKPTTIPSLMVGEHLNVLVLSNSLERKVLLQIKNSTLLADSPFPLQRGETMTVRVDQLHPMIILRMMPREKGESIKINEFLKLYRSNPSALKEMIAAAKDFLIHANLKELSKYLPKEDLQSLNQILDKIIISKKNLTNPLFLKDSILALGLDDESNIMKFLLNPSILGGENSAQSLKKILLKLSSDMTPILISSEYTKKDTQQIRQFFDFADHATTVIETLQIVNILAQEQDGLFLLQFPFQFPEGIRIQDLFIESDRNGREGGTGMQCRIVLFLDMDTLGEIAVDAGINDRTIRCTLKFSDPHVFDFMKSLLPEFYQSLSGIDYKIGGIQCVLERNIRSWKNDFLSNYRVFSQNALDVSV